MGKKQNNDFMGKVKGFFRLSRRKVGLFIGLIVVAVFVMSGRGVSFNSIIVNVVWPIEFIENSTPISLSLWPTTLAEVLYLYLVACLVMFVYLKTRENGDKT